MPQTALGNLGLNYEHTLGADDWKNSYDANWVVADWSLQAFVIDSTLLAEPGSPAVGDAYILPSGTKTGTNWGSDTGALTGAVAIYANVPGLPDSSPWIYLTPREGWRVFDRTNNYWLEYETSWRVENGVLHVGDAGGDYTLTPSTLGRLGGVLYLDSAFDDVNDSLVVDDETAQPFLVGARIRIYNRSGGDVPITDDVAVSWVDEDPTTWGGLPDDSWIEIVKTAADTWWLADVNAHGVHTTDITGFSTAPSASLRWSRVGRSVTLYFPSFSATSNASTMQLSTALPVMIRPSADQNVYCRVQDNGTVQIGQFFIPTSGVAAWFVGSGIASGFTSSGTKGANVTTVPYLMN